ncbi:MAG TPA: hypothetical protein VEY09_12360 [Pyrinomonadaceae bacterium]|nr:hypothetical protein [Pyrinomonadaceae bacterium]
MILLINGSFGVGKTTVAGLMRGSLKGSVIYDPEWAGLALMRLPRWVGLKGAGADDFQHIELWRRSVVEGVWLFRLFARGPVIVPMTFSHRPYFDEVVAGFGRLDSGVRVFCLKAELATVRGRLAGRGDKVEGPGSGWIARRIVECADAHRGSDFGEPVDTEGRTAREVATDIIGRLGLTPAPHD